MRSSDGRGHVLLDRRRRRSRPVNAGKRYHQPMIQLFELFALLSDDVPDFASVFGGEFHTQVAGVAESCYSFEQLGFGKGFGKSKECGPDGGGEVHLLGEPDSGIVLDDSDRFVHTSSKVESVPIQKVGTEVVYCSDAVFDRLTKNKIVSLNVLQGLSRNWDSPRRS